jgi:hypothetical protein
MGSQITPVPNDAASSLDIRVQPSTREPCRDDIGCSINPRS